MKIYGMKEYKKRKELEMEINRAADDDLSKDEIADLEQRLRAFPDLLESYNEIMALPDFSSLYGESDTVTSAHKSGIQKLLIKIDEMDEVKSFAETSIFWFKRYALAASIAIVAIVSGFYLNFEVAMDNEIAMEQLLYPYNGADSETYVTYLEELFDQ